MSDPVSNVEIEDVLSSIRRLVSEDTRVKPGSRPAHAERLVLTPSLRVTEDTTPAASATDVAPEPLVLDETLVAPSTTETAGQDFSEAELETEATDTEMALDLGSVALRADYAEDETTIAEEIVDIEVEPEVHTAPPVWLRKPVSKDKELAEADEAESLAASDAEIEEDFDEGESFLGSWTDEGEVDFSDPVAIEADNPETDLATESLPIEAGEDHSVSDHEQDVLNSLDALLAEAANAPGAPPEPTDEELDDSLAQVLDGVDGDAEPDDLDGGEDAGAGSEAITTQSILSKLVEQEVSRALGQDLVFEEEGAPVSAEDAELFAEAFEADEDLYSDADEDVEEVATAPVEEPKPARPAVRLSVVRPQPSEPDDGIEDAEILDDVVATASVQTELSSEDIEETRAGGQDDLDEVAEDSDVSGASLEAKIAELETLVGSQTEEWEPEPAVGAAAFFHRSSTRANRQDVASTSTEQTEAPVEHAAEAPEHAEVPALDEDALRAIVSDIIRQELKGVLGERITRNVRKLVRREIHRVLVSQDLE